MCGFRFYSFSDKSEQESLTEKEKQEAKEISKKYVDATGMWYISQMIWSVEHDLADKRNAASICVLQVRDTLKSESYWTNVWINQGKDLESEEAKNLKNLLEKLEILLTKA
jgi:hypothetical protein